MAIEVPKEPKIYTSVYDNFKGVDFTNDVTNVYRRRSPDGKNMLPDLDGRPYKRTGWEIKITAEHFREAAREFVTVSDHAQVRHIKTYYFELGGHDFMMIFTNIGVFSVSDFARVFDSNRGYVVIDGNCYVNYEPDWYGHLEYMPANLNPHTGFFFEGNGDAGFYVFCGLDLYQYKIHASSKYAFKKITPYIPTFLIGCDPHGVGDSYEQLSLLTEKRKVAYTCDGTTKNFVVPGGFSAVHSVETRNTTTAEWETTSYSYTASSGLVTFTSAPPEVLEGEDNLRITYTPDGSGGYTTEANAQTSIGYVYIYRKERFIRYSVNDVIGSWQEDHTNPGQTTYTMYSCSLAVDRMVQAEPITLYTINRSTHADVALTDTYATLASTAYGSAYTVTPKEALFNQTSYYDSQTTGQIIATDSWVMVDRQANKRAQHGMRTTIRRFPVFAKYKTYRYTPGQDEPVNRSRYAFESCTRSAVFGNGIVNNVFMTASDASDYNTRLWWSGAADPSYWPELNYIEVGSTDEPIMGLLKIDNYLGVVKRGSGMNTSIYLAYSTSFSDITTYAVKQGVNGIGAVSNGAFNILNDEPLFLTAEGVMAVDTNDDERQLRNRSYFVNKKLVGESGLDSAVSFVHDGMYWLAVNNHVYVLDGSQKNSWANTKTNLQYEAYYLENVPAHCFAKYKGDLWFFDTAGNMCRFKREDEANAYRDQYPTDPDWIALYGAQAGAILFQNLHAMKGQTKPKPGDTIVYGGTSNFYLGGETGDREGYTVTKYVEDVDHPYVIVEDGVPIDAVWSTISDDDGAVHFFKNLKKKGSMVSLLPSSDSGVKVYLKPDRKEPVFVCESDAKQPDIPFDVYMKKKVKKYKRLQIILENNTLDDAFGVDQIIKCYTMGNYSKNRG